MLIKTLDFENFNMHPAFVDIYKFMTQNQSLAPIWLCPYKTSPEIFTNVLRLPLCQCCKPAQRPCFFPPPFQFMLFHGDEEFQNGCIETSADKNGLYSQTPP